MTNQANEIKLGTSTAKPRVSVIIPLFNHEHYIEETVHSVLGQTFADFELIIINDGSTDRSEEVVKGITDQRIKYLSQENRGAPQTINRGIRIAQGEFIAILNSDDAYNTRRLEECVTLLESDPSCSAVFSHLEFVDTEGKFIKYLRGAEENWTGHESETSFKDEHNIVLDLLAGNFLTTTSNLFCRKDVFGAIGVFPELRYAHDYDFFLRLCYHHKVHLIEKPLVRYRIHSLNTVKENEAAVSFEVGLVLSRFFLNSDLHRLYKNDDVPSALMKLFNSVNTYDAEKMIMTLLLFGTKYPGITNCFFGKSKESIESLFRNACIERFKKINDGWAQWRETNESLIAMEKQLQEGWSLWRETNERLVAKEKDAQDGWNLWQETNQRLVAKEKDAQDGWNLWQETNERLIAKEKELLEAHGKLTFTKQQLAAADQQLEAANKWTAEKDKYIQALLNSRSFRLGRLLTWPLRKILGRD